MGLVQISASSSLSSSSSSPQSFIHEETLDGKTPEKKFGPKCSISDELPNHDCAKGRQGSIVVATRPSKLALVQTQMAIEAITAVNSPPLQTTTELFKTVKVASLGDRSKAESLDKLAAIRSLETPGGVFTKEIEDRILDESAEMAVHSLKDLPSCAMIETDSSLVYPAVLKREDSRDVVVLRGDIQSMIQHHHSSDDGSLDALPDGSVIGTSAVRRRAFIRRNYPNLIVKDIRGNVDTRLKKLENKDGKYSTHYDALILAAAGLKRLQLHHLIFCFLDPINYPYSPGQGALVCQCLKSNSGLITLVERADHLPTRIEVLGERQFLFRLNGGCQLSVGVACQAQLSDGIFPDSRLTDLAENSNAGGHAISSSNFLMPMLPTTLEKRKEIPGGKEVQLTGTQNRNSAAVRTFLVMTMLGQIWSENGKDTCSAFEIRSCLIASEALLNQLVEQNIPQSFNHHTYLQLVPHLKSQRSLDHHECVARSTDELFTFARGIGDRVALQILNDQLGNEILKSIHDRDYWCQT